MATFKDRFKELRTEKGLGQKQIGNLLGYSESTISLYESGSREPKKILDLIKIADYFDVTLDYLLGRTNEKNFYLVKDGTFEFEVNKINQDDEKNKQIKLKLKELNDLFPDKNE